MYVLYVCWNLTSLLNGINSSRRCVNESSMFFVIRRRPLLLSSAVVRCMGVLILCWLPSSHIFLPYFTHIRSRTATFYQRTVLGAGNRHHSHQG